MDVRVLAEGGTVAIRVPDQTIARALAAAADCPVTSTSANPSGQPPTADPDEVARALPAVDVLIDGGRDARVGRLRQSWTPPGASRYSSAPARSRGSAC